MAVLAELAPRGIPPDGHEQKKPTVEQRLSQEEARKIRYEGRRRDRVLRGHRVIVTGAGRGIGLAIAKELGNAGATVAITDINEENLQAAGALLDKEGINHVKIRANVADKEEAKKLVQITVEKLGGVDILINNAGKTRDRSFKKMTPEEWEDVINVDLNSVFYVTSAAVPYMVEQGYGRIVSISSVVAKIPNFGQANYGAAKAGILGFTRTVALELAKHNITVNAVCPGFTDTPMTQAMPESSREAVKAKVPLGRFAQPEEIAEQVFELVAPGGSGDFKTGAHEDINGGLYM